MKENKLVKEFYDAVTFAFGGSTQVMPEHLGEALAGRYKGQGWKVSVEDIMDLTLLYTKDKNWDDAYILDATKRIHKAFVDRL